MKCCVENCGKNDRDEAGTFNGITFHSFPKDPKQRAAWVESLSIPNWMPTKSTVICSEHFKENDFVTAKPGYRRLKRGVLPIIKIGFHGPAALRVCKICLALDAKMYQIKDNNLDKMYQNITGMAPRTDVNNRLPMGICWECASRLQTAATFRSKALLSDALLQAHLKFNTDLKVTDILNLHQKHTSLKSSLLVQEVFKFNTEYFEEHAPNPIVKPEGLSIGIPHNDEIEVEVKNLLTNKVIIKDEHRNEIVEETYLNNDYKTEIDLIPITEIGETLYNLENDINGVGTERNCVETNDSAQVSNMDYDNHVMKVENNEIVSDDRTSILFNLLHDDHIDNTINSNEAEVRVEDMKAIDVETNKEPVRNSKVKKNVDDEVLLWVRGRNRQTYVIPSTPVDENVFTIITLNHEHLKQEILERKDSEKYKQAPFKCTVCYRGFPTEDKHTRHVFQHSEESGPIKCVICEIRVKSDRHMRAHMKQQHTSEFVCKLCPMVTRNKNIALEHMKFHAGSKFQCPQCSLEFEKKTTLLSHLRLKHMSDCVCELCGYTFVSKHGVQTHKKKKHKFDDANAELEGPHCEVCEVKFLSQKAYDRHLRLSSKHIKSEDDPNRLRNDPSLKSRRLARSFLKSARRPEIRPEKRPRRRNANPMTVHNGPVTCEQCGVQVGGLRMYLRHFKYSHPGLNRTQFTSTTIHYMCEHCGKMFWDATSLAGHMSIHTGQKSFQCDHCKKTFSMKAYLVTHMRQHESVRPSYECRMCGKQFAHTFNLTRHMFIHTGLKPFKCDACEKAFRTSGELRAHVDHVHLNKPRPKRVRRRVKKCDLPSLE